MKTFINFCCKIFNGMTFHKFEKIVNYETMSYLFFGVITTIINYIARLVCYYVFHIDSVPSTSIAWIVAVIFAFFVNKLYVFESKSWERSTVRKEFVTFMIARLLSLAFDLIFIYISVDLLHGPMWLMSILSNIFVMIMNYFASKFISFKKKPEVSDEK